MKFTLLATTLALALSNQAFAAKLEIQKLSCSQEVERLEMLEGEPREVCFLNILNDAGEVTSRGISVKLGGTGTDQIYALTEGDGRAANGALRIKYKYSLKALADESGKVVKVYPDFNQGLDAKVNFSRIGRTDNYKVDSIDNGSVRATNFDGNPIYFYIQ